MKREDVREFRVSALSEVAEFVVIDAFCGSGGTLVVSTISPAGILKELNTIGEAVARLKALVAAEPLEMTRYSQRDPRWRNVVYGGGKTFGQTGCYAVGVTMLASLAGYDLTPPQLVAALQSVGVFSGAELSYPGRVTSALPNLLWIGRRDWRTSAADLGYMRAMLELGPFLVETEFVPGGAQPPADQHFVVAEAFTEDGADLVITDPWDGVQTHLLERYALDHWDLARAIYGARVFQVAGR